MISPDDVTSTRICITRDVWYLVPLDLRSIVTPMVPRDKRGRTASAKGVIGGESGRKRKEGRWIALQVETRAEQRVYYNYE